MALCARCNNEETQLYENGVPICLKCADNRKQKPVNRTASIQDILMRDLHEAALRAESATREFNAITSDLPSFIPPPDGTQRIRNASHVLKAARDEMMMAHKRLDDFVKHGVVPDDLKPRNSD